MNTQVLTPDCFRSLVIELADENPFAIRAALQVLETVFTDQVPTLAVSCEARPRLRVNLDFINAHCRSDSEVKAAICHEFLHVLLRHTETTKPLTPARHLAMDAVINAIIHRQHGQDMSALFSRYYGGSQDLRKLLRPMTEAETADLGRLRFRGEPVPSWLKAWDALYQGKLVVDDIDSLAEDLSSREPQSAAGFKLEGTLPPSLEDLLGDHQFWEALPEVLRRALQRTLREMNGHGIWRSPWQAGVGANPFEALLAAADDPVRRWERSTLTLLRRHLQPDRHSVRVPQGEQVYRLPVLSPGDRRASLTARWSPFLPEAVWSNPRLQPEGRAQVYLDVSGSMTAEMPLLLKLLSRLARHLRRPFWAFSDVVAPAEIRDGRLITQTTGGTSMACVLEHVARTRPPSAVVVTDGFIESMPPERVAAVRDTRLHVLLTRHGSAVQLEQAGLPYTRLEEVPS